MEALGSLAHEIRNAANSATVAFLLIRKGQVGVSGRTADVLQRSLSRIEILVQSALVEAKQRTNAPLHRERIRLAEVFEQIVDSAFPERGIQVETEVEEDLYLEADPRLIVSAVGNLVQNAIKCTRDKGTVLLRGRQEGGTSVIEVEDRCGGLPEGDPEDLFKPFTQKSTDPRGAGLGLHIVRTAIEAHRGTVTVRNPFRARVCLQDQPPGRREPRHGRTRRLSPGLRLVWWAVCYRSLPAETWPGAGITRRSPERGEPSNRRLLVQSLTTLPGSQARADGPAEPGPGSAANLSRGLPGPLGEVQR